MIVALHDEAQVTHHCGVQMTTGLDRNHAGLRVSANADIIEISVDAPIATFLPVAPRPATELQGNPGLKLMRILGREATGGGEVARHAQRLETGRGAISFTQPFLDQPDGQMGHVDSDPAAPELLCGVDRRAAAAKRIQHDIAGIGRGQNDPFEQGPRLLRGITEPLRRSMLQHGQSPDVVDVLVVFDLILQRAIGIARIDQLSSHLDALQLPDRLVTILAQGVEDEIRVHILDVKQDAVGRLGEQPLPMIVHLVVIVPVNLVPKILGAKHGIQHQLQVMARRRVAVQIKTAGRF